MEASPVSKPVDLVRLAPLMKVTSGRKEMLVGLIDGPVASDQPDLRGDKIRDISGKSNSQCAQPDGVACMHGTFVASLLAGKRECETQGICPDCSLLTYPIFIETAGPIGQIPRATSEGLAVAIFKCVKAGAKVLNLSIALTQTSLQDQRVLEEAMDYAAGHGVIIVAAAGNQGTVSSSILTRHRGVIPVVGCTHQGQPMKQSNLGLSIGRQGLRAPGERITGCGSNGTSLTLSGTSVAAPFVTGTIALLWSQFPTATTSEIKQAITQSNRARRTSVVPPLLDAWEAYQVMATVDRRTMR